jgi:hypothetical protein
MGGFFQVSSCPVSAFCATRLTMSATSRSLIRYALDRDGGAAREGWVPHGLALGLGAEVATRLMR